MITAHPPLPSPRPSAGRTTAPRCGIIAALWIPTDESGALRRDLLAVHLDWLKEKGIHGILALGSTGEFARMTLPRRQECLAAIAELAHPLPVVANISSIRLDEVIALGKAARQMGVAGAALMPPPFYPLPQDDIMEFFLRAADQIDLPVCLYNYPEVTGNRIGPEVIAAFAERAPMFGIKQSGAETDYHRELIALGKEKDFSVFTAADPQLERYLGLGAAGCMGGVPNFAPEYMVGVYEGCRRESPAEIAEMSSRLERIGEMLAPLCLPHNVRSALEARGFDPGAFKTVLGPATLATYRKTVENFRRTFAGWGLAPAPDAPLTPAA